jgi:transposase InsO family protein
MDGSRASDKYNPRDSSQVPTEIIYRFDMPRRVLIDNGTQFKGVKFVRCCADFGIQHQPSSAAHP